MKVISKFMLLLVTLMLYTGVAGYTEENTASEKTISRAKVIETQRVSHYLYLHVDKEGNKFWISTLAKYLPEDIGAGDTVEYSSGMLIQGFNSIALQKSFDTMFLVSEIKVVKRKSETLKE